MRRNGRGALTSGVLAVAVTCLAAASSFCDSQAASGAPLANALASPAMLARDVLSALATGDRERLEELVLSEHEFRTVVWPKLPSSRPEAGVPVDYAWNDLRTKSMSTLHQTLESLRGQKLELVSVAFSGRATDYGTFRVYRESVLDVRTASGERKQVRVFGSMIECAGRVKVFSYVVD